MSEAKIDSVKDDALVLRETTQRVLQKFVKSSDSSPPMNVEFKNLCAEVPVAPGSKIKKRILNGVSGKIEAGEFLALMGPSGAGKSSLLNVLGSRFQGDVSGEILVNGIRQTKKHKRSIAYVLQQDLLLPNLTVRETLEITAKLRLPKNFTLQQKMQRVDDIITLMGIKSCENTMVQLTSGGERKRASIANELLVNPSLLYLDEPTTGLDSATAYSILESLKELCVQGRTIICAIHQPSSSIFAKFDKLLLIAKGNIVYFGQTNNVTSYFEKCGYSCPAHYNPADFILELMTDNFESEDESLQNKEEIMRHIIQCWKDNIASKVCTPRNKKLINDEENNVEENNLNNNDNESRKNSLQIENNDLIYVNDKVEEIDFDDKNEKNNLIVKNRTQSVSVASNFVENNALINARRWPTNWFEQFLILVVRAFKLRKGHMLSKLNILQILFIALLAGLIWFRIPRTESNIPDFVAAAFFLQTYCDLTVMFRGVAYFPTERSVIKKERQSGCYQLSAYYASKFIAEFPVDSLLPLGACIIFYWLVDLGDNAEIFILYMLLSCLGIFTTNAYGTFLGCAFMNFDEAMTALAVSQVFFIMISGFFVQDKAIPIFISWTKYISCVRYSFLSTFLLILEIANFKCNKVASSYATCQNGNSKITGHDIKEQYGIKEELWFAILMLVVQAIVWHIFAYWCLRKNTSSSDKKLCEVFTTNFKKTN